MFFSFNWVPSCQGRVRELRVCESHGSDVRDTHTTHAHDGALSKGNDVNATRPIASFHMLITISLLLTKRDSKSVLQTVYIIVVLQFVRNNNYGR
jgi:hypothetical protein